MNKIPEKIKNAYCYLTAGDIRIIFEKTKKTIKGFLFPDKYPYAGSTCSIPDIIRHKASYFLCQNRNEKSCLPHDFPFFRVKGKSLAEDEILIAPHTNNFENGYIFTINRYGKVINFKNIRGFAYAFRKYSFYDGSVVYAYLNSYERFDSSYDNTLLVLLNDKFDKELGEYRMIKYGSVPYDNYPLDAHDYLILGKNHFIVLGVIAQTVRNIPGLEGKNVRIINSVIQEQKHGNVVFQFDLSEHPELYDSALVPENFADYINTGMDNESAADCGHLNSVDIDPSTGDWLLSFRSIGLVKIDRRDGHIKWVMGRKRCDIKGIDNKNICLYQHHARYQKDGSITVFDNCGSSNGKSRVCRYWIDEKSLSIQNFKEYKSKIAWSPFMGGAQPVDIENEVFELAYGGSFPYIGFEEYDFKNRKQNMKLVFEDGYDIYQVFAGEVNVNDDKE